MEIRENFIDKNGILYPNIREIAFTRDNLFGNLGTLVNETKREANDYFAKKSAMQIDDEGVYIYKSNYNSEKALRIYKCSLDPNFNGCRDEIFISKLQSIQPSISMTSFPIGIVTLDGNIIGQEIIYYENFKQLYEIKNEVSLKDLLLIYRKCLTILSELHKERIAYIDIHAKNFLINENLDVKLIDFEQDLVKFDDEHALKNSLQNYYKMINLLNERINIPVHYSKPETLEEAHRNLDALVKKLK